MKTIVKSILCTAVLVMSASGVMAEQAGNSRLDQWYRAKYGRNSPMAEARQKAGRENTANREQVTPETGKVAASAWLDQWYRAKYGRPSPLEKARRRTERDDRIR